MAFYWLTIIEASVHKFTREDTIPRREGRKLTRNIIDKLSKIRVKRGESSNIGKLMNLHVNIEKMSCMVISEIWT